MRKRQPSKTVEFSNLSQNHKAEFIQFLIKNNICFQEGKENCTASIAIKSNNAKSQELTQNTNKKREPLASTQLNNQKQLKQTRTISQKMETKPTRGKNPKDMTPRNQQISRDMHRNQLKTPTKENIKLNSSSLSYTKNGKTNKNDKKVTPVSNKPVKQIQFETKQFEHKNKTATKLQIQEKNRLSLSKAELNHSRGKEDKLYVKPVKKQQICRDRVENKYEGMFDSVGKGRAVRWPLNLLERSIEQIYDEVFIKNTQCLQTKNVGNALRTIQQTTFSQQIESYFQKKFKGSKLADTNLNNFLYSLSCHLSKQGVSVFINTFDQFLTTKLEHQDILYYLFARNVLKRELRAIEKMRQLSRMQGTYFPEPIKSKDISKLLRSIIGHDNQLLNEYRDLVLASMNGEYIAVYEFLKVLLDDFHQKRTEHVPEEDQSIQRPLFDRDQSYAERNDELTFGQDHEDQSYPEPKRPYEESFWLCLSYVNARDQLFELIKQKITRKSVEFIEILASDMRKDHLQLEHLQKLLVNKSQCLVRAVFEMNKMKWFKELAIFNPTEQDISTIQAIQMKYRELRENPNGKDIAQFCKHILTVQQLVNELQNALTASD